MNVRSILLALLLAAPPALLPAQDTASHPNPDANGLYHVGDGVSAPKVVSTVFPQVTEQARARQVAGSCTIGFTVDAKGRPQNVHIVESVAAAVAPEARPAALTLDDSALAAVRQYRFKPALYQGKPVPVDINIELSFRAQ
jgi:protein TonB